MAAAGVWPELSHPAPPLPWPSLSYMVLLELLWCQAMGSLACGSPRVRRSSQDLREICRVCVEKICLGNQVSNPKGLD